MSNEEKNNGFNRVVITGMGAISPAGFGVDALWSKVASGECCFTLLPEEKRAQLNVSVVGAIPDYDRSLPSYYVLSVAAARCCRVVRCGHSVLT